MRWSIQSGPGRRLAAGITFVAVLAAHFAWINIFAENQSVQKAWLYVRAAESAGWWNRYITGGHYWLGYAYALSISFGVYALLLYINTRTAATGRFAIGGISLSGFLAVFGCFLVGCCGSPMLGVYLSLFGASFLPFAKPLVALITTVLITGSWFWLLRESRRRQACDCR